MSDAKIENEKRDSKQNFFRYTISEETA